MFFLRFLLRLSTHCATGRSFYGRRRQSETESLVRVVYGRIEVGFAVAQRRKESR